LKLLHFLLYLYRHDGSYLIVLKINKLIKGERMEKKYGRNNIR